MNAYTYSGINNGWGTYPWACGGNYYEGVVLSWHWIGQEADDGNIGRIPVHEAGHYFGLYHTSTCFCSTPDSCGITGDLICDVKKTLTGFCFVTTPCPSEGPGEPHNYLTSGVSDDCINQFSAEQVARMRCALQTYRPNGYLGIVESSIQTTVTTLCDRGNSYFRFTVAYQTNKETANPDTLQVFNVGYAGSCTDTPWTTATATPSGVNHSITIQRPCVPGTYKFNIRSRDGILGTRSMCRTFVVPSCPTCPPCDPPCELE